MMNNPTVSVVIPTYNYGRFVQEALRSALAQTYGALEVIVVDDGSTDDTQLRVTELGAAVRYIYQPNAGVASARNTGFRHCHGEYVAFLDADDLWRPHKIGLTVEALRRDPEIGVVYHWWALMDATGTLLPQKAAPTYQGDVCKQLLLGCFFPPSMSMVRRVCFEQIGLFDPVFTPAEDWEMWLRLALAGVKFGCVREVLASYRIHGASGSANRAQHFNKCRLVLDTAFSRMPLHPQNESVRIAAYRNLFLNYASDFKTNGQLSEARELFVSAVALEPQALSRPGFYLSLAANLLPYGYRTSQQILARLDVIIPPLLEMLHGLFTTPGISPVVVGRRRASWSALWFMIAVLQGFRGQWLRAASSLAKSLWTNPFVSLSSSYRALSGRWRQVLATLEI